MMSYITNGIDTVVSAKKTWVKTFVLNEEFQKPLNTFIDAQAKFAKDAAASLNDFARLLV